LAGDVVWMGWKKQIERYSTFRDTNGLYWRLLKQADNSGNNQIYFSSTRWSKHWRRKWDQWDHSRWTIGSGTVIENVEVNREIRTDGIEWFGGTVNVKNAIVWNAGDDGQLGHTTKLSGTLTTHRNWAGSETDHTLEIDGPEGSKLGSHTWITGSIKGNNVAEFGDF